MIDFSHEMRTSYGFDTKRNSIWWQICLSSLTTIRDWFRLMGFRGDALCVHLGNSVPRATRLTWSLQSWWIDAFLHGFKQEYQIILFKIPVKVSDVSFYWECPSWFERVCFGACFSHCIHAESEISESYRIEPKLDYTDLIKYVYVCIHTLDTDPFGTFLIDLATSGVPLGAKSIWGAWLQSELGGIQK